MTAATRPPRILVSGLRSTGKSSLVSALWGDSELVPAMIEYVLDRVTNNMYYS